jgi:hypothetical protein
MIYERNYIYDFFILQKIEAAGAKNLDQEEQMEAVGYLNRFLLYLIDKVVQGISYCCYTMKKNLEMENKFISSENQLQKEIHDKELVSQNQSIPLSIYPPSLVFLV